MKDTLANLRDESTYLERLANTGRAYSYWKVWADEVLTLANILLNTSPMTAWFEGLVEGYKERVISGLTFVGVITQLPHDKFHRRFLWYFRETCDVRKEDYLTVIKLYKQVLRHTNAEGKKALFKGRIERLQKEMNSRFK